MPPRRNTKKAASTNDTATDVSSVAPSTVTSVAPTDVSAMDVDPVPKKAAPKKTTKKKAAAADPAPAPVAPPEPTIEKKKRKKATKKVQKKRGPSSYILFTKDYRGMNADKIAKFSLSEMSKACGEAWKALSEEEKAKYKAKADEIRAELRANDPPPQPKKPMSSYLAFAMEQRKSILKAEPNLKLGEISKRCGELWKALTDNEKAEWKSRVTVPAPAIPVS